MNITFKQNYPNIIVFTHNDMDGIFSGILIKYYFDNNLVNDMWERNVNCYTCTYGEKYNLNYFKEKVNENFIPNKQNIVFMTDYGIQPNSNMILFWNWLKDKGCEFYWIDHHITAIEQLNHLNIPGLQKSNASGCMNTFEFLSKNFNEINENEKQKIPLALQFANDFDIWNKKSIYSWEKQLYPFCYFINSLGIDLNNNEGELVQTLLKMLKDNNYTNQCINIGKYIYKYLINEYKIAERKIYSILWNDWKCLCINSSYKGSTQFENHEEYKDADILIAWSFNGNKFQYGLYTSKPNINVGEIAKNYLNGGGHAGAAGGETKEFLFHPLLFSK